MKLPKLSQGTIRSKHIPTKSVRIAGITPSQGLLDFGLIRLPQSKCTKWCTDCQNCDVYCCQGTTPQDIGVLSVDDD